MSAGAAFFVSYSRGDAASRKLAAAFSYSLPRLGHAVFVDVVGLLAGEKWTRQLEQHIDACDVFVILVSEKALSSNHVRRELDRALARNRETESPRIVPVRTQFTREFEGDERRLDEFERLDWQSKSDTPYVVERLDEAVSHLLPARDAAPPPPRSRRRWRIPLVWATAALTLLLAVFGALTYAQARALAQANNDEDARTAFNRLRALRLAGSRYPERLAEAYFARRADALDAEAAPLLVSRLRREADRGLALAALAAFKRGGPPSDAAREYAEQQHYALLEATLAFEEPSSGTALAVWRGPQRLLVAEGTRVWSCAADARPCESIELAQLDAVRSAAFVSETELLTVSVDGSAHRWDLGTFGNPIASAIREGEVAISAAAGEGGGAIVFEASPRLLVVLGDGRRVSGPLDLPPVARATFGPCDRCVTLVLEDGRVTIWQHADGRRSQLIDGANDAAATQTGFVAAAMRDGTVRFFDAEANPVGRPVPLRFESVRQLAISDDGRRAAVVHDDVVSVVDAEGGVRQLIPADRKPAPTAATWAGDVLVTRTPSEVRLWRLGSGSVADVAPGDPWTETRKKLGIAADSTEPLGWNRIRRRIDAED